MNMNLGGGVFKQKMIPGESYKINILGEIYVDFKSSDLYYILNIKIF